MTWQKQVAEKSRPQAPSEGFPRFDPKGLREEEECYARRWSVLVGHVACISDRATPRRYAATGDQHVATLLRSVALPEMRLKEAQRGDFCRSVSPRRSFSKALFRARKSLRFFLAVGASRRYAPTVGNPCRSVSPRRSPPERRPEGFQRGGERFCKALLRARKSLCSFLAVGASRRYAPTEEQRFSRS